MALNIPPGISSRGNISVFWVDAIANQNVPKLTEVGSPTAALDITCYLTGDWGGLTGEQAEDPDTRFCSKQVFESPGDIKFKVADLVYVMDSQHPLSITAKAAVILTPGKQGFLVLRYAKDVEEALAVGDVVHVVPATLGVKTPTRGEGNTPIRIVQRVFVRGAISEDVAMVA